MEQPTLTDWLDNHNITYTIRHDLLIIPGFGRCLIQEEYEHIFKQDKKTGEVTFNAMENIAFLLGDDINYIVFPFGNRWFYVDIREEPSTQQFHILRWLGNTPKQRVGADFYPLGIHSGYELLNGSGLLKDWCAKAKWLGYKGLGCADMNTMASTLDLQTSATDKELKYVFGYSTQVDFGSERIGVKIYSQTQQGFKNLLRIQKAVCVDNVYDKHIDYIELLNRAKGNVLVFDKLTGEWLAKQLSEDDTCLSSLIDAFDGWVYFQVDTTEYKADRIDSQVLLSMKAYFDAFYKGGTEYMYDVRPVLIQDVYYLDKEDWKTKIVLNKVDIGAAHEQSNQQYLKTLDELYNEFRNTFSDKYDDNVFYDMCSATAEIIEEADAAYDLTENYMPQYEMTPEEKAKYGTNLNMFNQLIEEGFKRLVPEGQEEAYRKRIEYEKYILLSTDNVDYCLIQLDDIKWSNAHGILTGMGRGSAGGALTLYLLGITLIDPMQYDLIFERFLLPERAGLAPCEVTKMESGIKSTNFVEIETEEGIKYKFDIDAKFEIIRNGERKSVYADELQVDDDIQWDNKDLLWSLK